MKTREIYVLLSNAAVCGDAKAPGKAAMLHSAGQNAIFSGARCDHQQECGSEGLRSEGLRSHNSSRLAVDQVCVTSAISRTFQKPGALGASRRGSDHLV